MNKIKVFGDSYSNRDCIRKGLDNSKSTKVEKGFQDFLGETFKMEVDTCAISGGSCYDILNMLTSRIHTFHKGDIVICLLTNFDRENHPITSDEQYGDLHALLMGDLSIDYEKRDWKLPFLKGAALSNIARRWLTAESSKEDLYPMFNRIDYIRGKGGKEKDEAIEALIKHTVNSRYGMDENYRNYFLTWFKNLGIFFKQNEIVYKVYTSSWWIPIQTLQRSYGSYSEYTECECGHWNEIGHKIFSDLVAEDIRKDPYKIIHECSH